MPDGMRGGGTAVPLSFIPFGRDVAGRRAPKSPSLPLAVRPDLPPGRLSAHGRPSLPVPKRTTSRRQPAAPPERSPRYLIFTLLLRCFIILSRGPGGVKQNWQAISGGNSHFVYGTQRKPARPIENTGFERVRSIFWSEFSLTFSLYRFITSFMKLSIRAALSRFMRSVTWPYLSSVKAAVAWPKFPCTVLISSPARMAFTA